MAFVSAAIFFFVVQISIRIGDYYDRHTTISVRKVISNKVQFPAVTFCNLNQFRITETTDRGLYQYINQVYSAQNTTSSK